MSAQSKSNHWGIVGQFETAQAIYHACEEVRDAGFRNWDAHTPFPVHGLDNAMGMPKSKLPWFVLVIGLSGTTTGILLQYWVHSVEYPLLFSGKPFFAWPAYVPVIFELSVLFSAFTCLFGMLALNGLPRLNHPLFGVKAFERVTDDRFFISIEATDPNFDPARTAEFLKKIGATHVELVE